MTTPFVLLDNLGPKQLPESIEWHVKPTTNFFTLHKLKLYVCSDCIFDAKWRILVDFHEKTEKMCRSLRLGQ